MRSATQCFHAVSSSVRLNGTTTELSNHRHRRMRGSWINVMEQERSSTAENGRRRRRRRRRKTEDRGSADADDEEERVRREKRVWTRKVSFARADESSEEQTRTAFYEEENWEEKRRGRRRKDANERYDLTKRITMFYPGKSFEPFGDDPEKEADSAEKWLRISGKMAKNKAGFTLGLLSIAYVHCAASGFLVSALLPAISVDLKLSDGEGALLTTLFTVVYSLCLPLLGIAADKTNRKNLLAAGAFIWTAGTVMTANANTFTELVIARIVFAIGNGPQNPIAFSLLPELFPRNKNIAMSLYNMGVHVGRFISFSAGALVAAPQTATDSLLNPNLPITLPIEYLSDIKHLGSHTILYVTGDSVVLSPNAGTAMESVADALMSNFDLGWRELFETVAIPGLIIAPLLFLVVSDPGRGRDGSSRAVRRKQRRAKKRLSDAKKILRKARGSDIVKPVSDLNIVSLIASYDEDDTPRLNLMRAQEMEQEAVEKTAVLAVRKSEKSEKIEDLSEIIEIRADLTINKEERELEQNLKKEQSFFFAALKTFKNPSFRALTFAATLTDVAGWSMIAFQATFYQRTFGLEPSEYNNLLALVIPGAGAIGGLTSGYFSDRLNSFQRKLMVAGGTILCAPLIAESLESSSYQVSMAYLFFGFMLSEFFRSPTAVMTREIDPENPSATVAAHLAVRNLTAGIGPIAVATLISQAHLEIKDAMLFAPTMYIFAGLAFWHADGVIERAKLEKQMKKSLVSR